MYLSPTTSTTTPTALALKVINSTFQNNLISGAGVAPRGGALGISLDGVNTASGSIVIESCDFLDNELSIEGAGT